MGATEAIAVVGDARRAAAVLSPLRRRILGCLDAPDSATGVARRLGLPRQRVNYHLRELEREGFVELDAEVKRRGCVERRLRPTARAWMISPTVLGELAVDPDKLQDRFSSAYLIAVAARTVNEVSELRRRAERSGKKVATVTAQADVDFASPADLKAFSEELASAVAHLSRKYHRPGPGSRTHRVVVGSHPKPAPPEPAPTTPRGTGNDKEDPS